MSHINMDIIFSGKSTLADFKSFGRASHFQFCRFQVVLGNFDNHTLVGMQLESEVQGLSGWKDHVP